MQFEKFEIRRPKIKGAPLCSLQFENFENGLMQFLLEALTLMFVQNVPGG